MSHPQPTEAEERETYVALVRAGCSIPQYLMKYQREHNRYIRECFCLGLRRQPDQPVKERI